MVVTAQAGRDGSFGKSLTLPSALSALSLVTAASGALFASSAAAAGSAPVGVISAAPAADSGTKTLANHALPAGAFINRPTMSMAAYRAIPRVFARVHPRHLTPSVSTVTFGVISIAIYVVLNYTANAANGSPSSMDSILDRSARASTPACHSRCSWS